MGGVGRVEVIGSKGCSKLFVDISSSFRGLQPHSLDPPLPMSPASSNTVVTESRVAARSVGPLSGLVICVTGLSKEARMQVMEATERLGGQYSPHLHPHCTHLVVQSFCGRKFEHALKHGSKTGLLIVTLGWFVDSVRNNVRLSESLYSVKVAGEGVSLDVFNRIGQKDDTQTSCLPMGALEHHKKSNTIEEPQQNVSEREYMRRTTGSPLFGHSFYVDVGVSDELRRKVVEAASAQGATLVDQWFVGCGASHIVCEGNSIRKYLGHSTNIVTPLWVLKTVKEKQLQRLVHISADLAKQTGIMVESIQSGIYREEINEDIVLQDDAPNSMSRISHEERQKIVNLAKDGVRKRRGKRMQTCQTPMRPITPSSLLDSICWSISEPTSTASIYMDSSSVEDANLQNTSVFYDAKEDGKESEFSFVNLSRPLKESEKSELVLKSHFLTILFPVDRFSEMGPCSRTYFSDNNGFKCLQVLDYIYAFYQENMSIQEIEVAIHTDSRYADRLRAVYCSRETTERGYAEFKRIEFMGSRKSFEMLKRVSGDNSSNVYELLIRA
ncbi:PREDICTED: uncharacterized protein LOC109174631 isoform X2 [Ipomoea nil]|uniref:uncharacterized protein LOC109174631 isoform X2 n=1 Tax=Ipomoea nil TaxID=35883 RepID=UPI0009009FE8|nr:PREDICTED: uncharacterized protein LOC109174631 isoform X2 [Ipomoea nil]